MLGLIRAWEGAAAEYTRLTAFLAPKIPLQVVLFSPHLCRGKFAKASDRSHCWLQSMPSVVCLRTAVPVGDQRCAPCHIFDTPAQCHKMRAEKKPGRRKEGMGIGRDGEGAAPFRRESEGQKGVGDGGENMDRECERELRTKAALSARVSRPNRRRPVSVTKRAHLLHLVADVRGRSRSVADISIRSPTVAVGHGRSRTVTD